MANLDDKLIKKAYKKHAYTEKEMIELSNCANLDSGPLYFMEQFLYVQHSTRGKIKFVPYEYQKELVDVYHNNRYSIALISRQQGKCLYHLSTLKIRNKNTGEIMEVNFNEFEELLKGNKNA